MCGGKRVPRKTASKKDRSTWDPRDGDRVDIGKVGQVFSMEEDRRGGIWGRLGQGN